MFVMSVCTFPPLFSGESINLTVSDSMVIKKFSVPVDKNYPLAIVFKFESDDARLKDKIVGDRYSEYCRDNVSYEQIPVIKRQGLGIPIGFNVIIRNTRDNSVVINKIFESLCASSGSDREKTRIIGFLDLKKGNYIAEISNIKAQAGLLKVNTSLALYGGYGK